MRPRIYNTEEERREAHRIHKREYDNRRNSSEERKAYNRERMRRLWADPVKREEMIKRSMARHKWRYEHDEEYRMRRRAYQRKYYSRKAVKERYRKYYEKNRDKINEYSRNHYKTRYRTSEQRIARSEKYRKRYREDKAYHDYMLGKAKEYRKKKRVENHILPLLEAIITHKKNYDNE